MKAAGRRVLGNVLIDSSRCLKSEMRQSMLWCWRIFTPSRLLNVADSSVEVRGKERSAQLFFFESTHNPPSLPIPPLPSLFDEANNHLFPPTHLRPWNTNLLNSLTLEGPSRGSERALMLRSPVLLPRSLRSHLFSQVGANLLRSSTHLS